MYILKNAIKNISRSKGRNILIGIIVLVIAASSCIALSIKQSATTAEEKALKSLDITATIGVDRQTLMKNAQKDGTDIRAIMQSTGNLTLDEMKKYASSSYVSDFNYYISSSISKSDGFEPIKTTTDSVQAVNPNANNNKNNQRNNMKDNQEENQPGKGFSGMGAQGDFTLIGYNSEKAMTSFVNGTNKITSGVMFQEGTSEPVCIISDQVASLNSKVVGDKITVTNPNLDTEIYELTIVGIYSTTDTSSDNNMMRFSTASDPANQIYTSYNAVKVILDASTTNAIVGTDTNGSTTTTALRTQVSGTYSFSELTKFESFKTDVKAMGLSDNYTVSSQDATSYEQSLVPIKNLGEFADLFLILVLSIGGVILVVLNIFNIRERKYEVGVLTAIGMKKGKVALQFITELFIVTLIAIVLGTGVGAATSVPTANTLLKNQITAQEAQASTQSQNFGRGGQGQFGMQNPTSSGSKSKVVNYIDNINASTDTNVLIKLIGIGIILTIISSCGSVIFILRYEPLKILSNRS
jgi:putative ABC transport system permease protein